MVGEHIGADHRGFDKFRTVFTKYFVYFANVQLTIDINIDKMTLWTNLRFGYFSQGSDGAFYIPTI